MTGKRQDRVLKAVTGLEGGAVASGSTCGVLSGGALGIALMRQEDLRQGGIPAAVRVMEDVGRYVDWFHNAFGTTTCRARTGVDFYTASGQLRYLLPGDRMARCLRHINHAARYLYDLPADAHLQGETCSGRPLHCAATVLRQVRERTGVGDETLENLAFVFDGGLAFRGGLCGALAGALMALNLVFGTDARSMRYHRTIKAFVVGHVNLLVKDRIGMPEPFGIGRDIVGEFRAKAGSIECRDIVSRSFAGWDDFQAYLAGSAPCAALMAAAADAASRAVEKNGAAGRKACTRHIALDTA